MKIRFVQLNIRKSALAAANLQVRLSESNEAFCCLIQEPSVYKKRLNNAPVNSDRFPSPFITDRPRAAIFASRSLKFIELPELEDKDTAVCLAKLNGHKTVIASVYLEIENNEVISQKLKATVEYASSNNFPLIIGMVTAIQSCLVVKPIGEENC